MNKIKIHHFLGDSICSTMDDVLKTLDQSVNGVNEFFIAHEHTMFPYLTVLINGPYSYVYCVPDEVAAGSLAFSEDAEMDLDPGGISIFYTNNPSEEIEICNDYVIPKSLAVEIVKEFAETGKMSDCAEWEEL